MKYTRTQEDAILREAVRRARAPRFTNLEHVLEAPHGFAVQTLTPLQRAVCRLVDGEPLADLAEHEHVRKAIGDARHLAGSRPKKVVVCAGIRTFKSMLAAAAGVRSPHVVDTSPMLATEGGRFSVVSTTKDNARKVISHALSLVVGAGKMQQLLAERPTTDTIPLRHPEGRQFTLKVTHGGRAGAGLVTDWSAGVVFDEASRMLSSDQGVINLDDAIDSVEGRLLDGAQMFLISSPWGPFGTFYKTVTDHFLKPTRDLLVVWPAHASWLNPVWWTQERCAEMRERNPEAFETDVRARFRTPEESLYGEEIVEPSRRVSPVDLPPEPGHVYEAAMDPATRRNAWTLGLVTKSRQQIASEDGVIWRDWVRVALARQWLAKPGQALRPREVMREIAETVSPYGVTSIATDQWSFDALKDIADEFGLHLVQSKLTPTQKVDAYGKIKTYLEEGQYELHPDQSLKDDLLRVKRRTTQTAVQIVLPQTQDGRHCDYAPVLALASAPYLLDLEEPEPEYGSPEWWRRQEKLDIEREMRQIEDQQRIDELDHY